MKDITVFNPLRGLARFDPLSREMDDLFQGFFMKPIAFNQASVTQFPIDVTENDSEYVVRAEIPGFKKEDLHISVNGDQILISAESKKEKEEKKGDQVVLRECYYGKHYRSFTLPQSVDDAKATAKYENGILNLVLPKKPEGARKKIAIQ
ncbi:MAG: Hsp20/alpha crystallin family protein [Halothiobacillus sp.]